MFLEEAAKLLDLPITRSCGCEQAGRYTMVRDAKHRLSRSTAVVLTVTLGTCLPLLGQAAAPREFISLPAAQPALKAMSEALPPGLKAASPLDAQRWSKWVQDEDRAIRERLDRGTEDTLTNLLRFGVTFTKEYRITDEYLVRYGESSLVNAFAENRSNDLIVALTRPDAPEGIADMRRFVEKKGFSLKMRQERAKLKKYLLGNLARLRDEFLKYRAQTKDEKRFQLFQDRGISLDTNLWPDYAIDAQFQHMVQKGLLKPGQVRRVAIVGPGLDFANKEAGNDFYPPQTVQPFAVLDSLFRLRVADPAVVELYTLDISQEVNAHIERTKRKAIERRSYTVQLPWNTERPMSEAYRASFSAYWEALGKEIGEPLAPIPVPSAAAATKTRALKIRPEIVRKLTALDLNVVYQHLVLSSEQRFDLVIGTNIFVYYGEFEQLLARHNLAAMMKPGGYLLSNDKLADKLSYDLEAVLETPITSSEQPLVQDMMFCYQRGK